MNCEQAALFLREKVEVFCPRSYVLKHWFCVNSASDMGKSTISNMPFAPSSPVYLHKQLLNCPTFLATMCIKKRDGPP